jgi:hypothetical protein
MKSLHVLFLTAAVLLCLFLPSPAFAQPAQISYTVTLNWFSLQVTYPSEVMPGEALNVSVQGTPEGTGVYLQNLTAIIYYADASGLHQLASQTLVSNPTFAYAYYYGAPPTGSFSKSFTVNVPQDAPRTSLMAVFSETAQYSNYYANYYYEPNPFAYWYYGNPVFYSFYPAFTTSTDQGISPLSYIEATTPEYVALQSEYHMLQQQLNQTQTQNQQLQTTITRQSAMISQLNQQLTSANSTAQTYEAVAVVFVIIALALAAFSIYQTRSKAKMKRTGTSEEPNQLE